MTNIPSDEDFARASRIMADESRNLDMVCEHVKQHFRAICPLHNVYMLPQRDVNFRAYIFFKKDSDIDACKRSGMTDAIVEFVLDELERAGRGKKEEIKVAFEFDSDENVDRNYGGDYFDRLR